MPPKSRNVNAGGRKLALGLVVSGLVGQLAQGGCAESTPIDFVLLPDGGATTATIGTGGSTSGTGGSTRATGGSDATGGTIGSGGQTSSGGSPGTGGSSATGGVPGTGGVRGTGGVTATGGVTGTGGVRATGGTTGSGGAGGSGAPTFTQIYQTILSASCAGSQCHSPGTQGGVSFASQSSAYSAVHSRVVAGNANGSSLYTLVNGGRMPPGGKLPAAQLSMIAAWINAGAPNN